MKNKTLWAIAFAIAVAVFTLLLFILIPNKDGSFAVTYIFNLIAIAGFFTSLLFIGEKDFKRFPQNFSFLSIAWKYLIFEVIISILFMALAVPALFYLLAQIVLLATISLIVIAFFIGKKHVDTIEDTSEENRSALQFMVADVDALIGKAENLPESIREKTKRDLQNIQDDIRFSDPVGNPRVRQQENEIKESIFKLEDEIDDMNKNDSADMQKFSSLVLSLRRQIKERNNQVKLFK